MTTQDILCAVSIISTIATTLLLIYNVKTARIKFIKNNILVAGIVFIVLVLIAVIMIFLRNKSMLKYALCLLCGFGFPCIMVLIVFIFEKLITISNKLKENNQDKEENIK